jgi:VCBS repeat-containing protein
LSFYPDQKIFINGVDTGRKVLTVTDSSHFVADGALPAAASEAELSFYSATAFLPGQEVTTAEASVPLVSTITVHVPWTPVIYNNGTLEPGYTTAAREYRIAYIEQFPAIAIAASDATITDQGGLLRELKVTLTNPLDNLDGEPVLEFLVAPRNLILSTLKLRGIEISGNGDPESLTVITSPTLGEQYTARGLTGATQFTFTSAEGSDTTSFQIALRGVGYLNNDDAMNPAQRVVNVSAIDVDGNVGLDAQTLINLTAVNDRPVGIDSDVTTDEDQNYIFTSSDFGFSDPTDAGAGGVDPTANNLLAIKISTLPTVGELQFDGVTITQADVDVGYFVSKADIDAEMLVYVPADDNNGTLSANGTSASSFTFQVQDDGGTLNGGLDLDASANTMSVDINPINDAPVLTGLTTQATTIDENDVTNAGQLVGDLLGEYGDVDTTTQDGVHASTNGTLSGMAVYAAISGDIGGYWEFSTDAGSNWATLEPTSGNAVLLRSIDMVRFVPDEVGGTTADGLAEPTLSYYVWDQSNNTGSLQGTQASVAAVGGTTPYSEVAGTVSITVTDVNDAPVATVPLATQTGNEDGSVTISGISFDDLDISARTDSNPDNNTVEITLSVSHGTFVLATIDGLSGVGDNTGVSSMTFTGTLTAVNAAVNSVVYTPVANYNGSDTLTVSINDLGNVQDGTTDPALTDSQTIAITINPINDAPVLTGVETRATTIDENDVSNEGQLVSVLLGEYGDVDTTTQDGVHASTNGTLSGMAVYAAISGDIGGYWEFSTDAGSNWATLEPTSGNAVLLRSIDMVRFVPDEVGGTTADGLAEPTLSYYVWDQSNNTGSLQGTQASVAAVGGTTPYSEVAGTVSITVTDVNDAPVATVPLATQTGNEDGSVTISGISFDDLDISARTDSNPDNNTVEITLSVSHGTFVLATIDGLSGVGDNTGVSSMTFTGTLTAVNAAVNSVVYTPVANYNGSDTLTVSINDLGNVQDGTTDPALTDSQTIAITINPINDAPVLTGVETRATTIDENDVSNEGQLVSVLLGEYGDVDTTTQDGVHASTNGTLSGMAVYAAISGDIGGYWEFSTDAGSNWATLEPTSGNAVLLRSIDMVRFVPDEVGGTTADGLAEPTLSYYVWDQSNNTGSLQGTQASVAAVGGTTPYSEVAGTVSITVTDVNDAPVATVPLATQTGNEDGSVTISGISFDDLDISARTDSNPDNNTVEITLSVSHGTFVLATIDGLSGVGDNTGVSSMTFTGTLTAVNAAVNSVVYTPVANYNGSDTLTVSINDLGNVQDGTTDPALTDSQTIAITINPINDAPVLTGVETRATTIDENDVSNEGQLVSVLLGEYGDVDTTTQDGVHASTNGTLSGMAVYAAISGDIGGYWEFSTDAGSNWATLEPTSGNAVLLRSIDMVRFVPDAENGTTGSSSLTEPTLSYYVWDQSNNTDGENLQGTQVDVSADGAVGGTAPYSIDAGTVSITVTDINDAPVVDLNGEGAGVDDIGLSEGVAFNPRGSAVYLFNSNLTISDVDRVDSVKQAVVTLDPDTAVDNLSLFAIQEGITYETLSLDDSGLPAGITVSGNGTGTDGLTNATELTFVSSDGSTDADFEAALLTVLYNNTNPNAFAATRKVAVQVWDQGYPDALAEDSVSATATLDVHVNWGAVIDLNGADTASRNFGDPTPLPYTENQGYLSVTDTDMQIIDQDGNLRSVTVTLFNHQDNDVVKHEYLSISSLLAVAAARIGVTGNGTGADGLTGATVLTFTALNLDPSYVESDAGLGLDGTYFQLAIRTVQYINTSEDPTINVTREVLFTSRDMDTSHDPSGNAGVSATTFINVSAIDDAPVISVGVSDRDSETLPETNAGLSVGGTLTVTHLDYQHSITASVASVVASGDTAGLSATSDDAALLAMLSVNTGEVISASRDPLNTTGTINWSFDSTAEDFDYLNQGQTLTLTYTVRASDNQSPLSDDQTVVITITGTNDTPVVAAPLTSTEAEGQSSYTLDLLDGASDVDYGDTLSVDTVTYAILDASNNPVPTGNSGADVPDGLLRSGSTLTVDPSDLTFDGLALGESRIIVVSYFVKDVLGADVYQTQTITITGTNDQPEITVVDVTGEVTEDAALTAGNLVETGSVTFADADDTDELTSAVVLSAAVASTGATVSVDLQTALTNAMTLTQTGSNDGSITWDFALDNILAQYLADGETVTATYTITVSDDSGAGNDSLTQDVTVVITGSNDQPEITVVDVTGEVTEDAALTAGNLVETGSVTFADADDTDELTSAVVLSAAVASTGATVSVDLQTALTNAMTLTQTGSNDGSITWDFALDNILAQYLADGETVTATYTITVSDDSGAGNDSLTQDVTVVITGSNDQPEITVVDVTGEVTEDAALTAGNLVETGSVTFADADDTDELTSAVVLSAAVASTGATVSVDLQTALTNAMTLTQTGSNDGSITWDFALDNILAQYLADGETVTATYTITVSDDSGAGNDSLTQDVTVVITGSNDQPEITVVDVTGEVTEDAALTAGNLVETGSVTFADADDTDVLTSDVALLTAVAANGALSVSADLQTALSSAMTLSQTGSNDGSITWDFALDNSLAQYLADGETVTATYTITLSDDSGAGNDSLTQDVTVVITGTNDGPTAITLTPDNLDELPGLAQNFNPTIIGNLSSSDLDVTDTHTYTILAGGDGAFFTLTGANSSVLINPGILSSQLNSPTDDGHATTTRRHRLS